MEQNKETFDLVEVGVLAANPQTEWFGFHQKL